MGEGVAEGVGEGVAEGVEVALVLVLVAVGEGLGVCLLCSRWSGLLQAVRQRIRLATRILAGCPRMKGTILLEDFFVNVSAGSVGAEGTRISFLLWRG